jgi:hypothetical protein
MYHSPGLRDGVSCQGPPARPDHPKTLGAELASARFILAGNKFGRSQVFRVSWFCGHTLLGRAGGRMQGERFP